MQSRRNLDRVTFEKVSELVKLGHQVMVFVHARKETVKAAQALKESATADGCLDDFNCEDHPSYRLFRRDIAESRNQEMRQLFDFGFGIHHAGMLRSDRNMMERMFGDRAIKVFLPQLPSAKLIGLSSGPLLYSHLSLGCQPSGSRR